MRNALTQQVVVDRCLIIRFYSIHILMKLFQMFSTSFVILNNLYWLFILSFFSDSNMIQCGGLLYSYMDHTLHGLDSLHSVSALSTPSYGLTVL